MIFEQLRQLQRENKAIRVALVGAGAMGVGIAYQIARTPGMELVSITDINLDAARKAADASGAENVRLAESGSVVSPGTLWISTEPFSILNQSDNLGIDVLVEATNTISFAARVCVEAMERGIHVVLMNAEVDLAVGPILNHIAAQNGVCITSDAGDQHGVLARMIDEIQLWDFRIVMAGNIKGFLNRYATAQELLYEAEIRNLSPVQCCAYTDGTKLNVEMAAIANGTGLVPFVPGMEGPPAKDVHEVFDLFDCDKYGETGVVDYILGARPGGGVFVIGHCDNPVQKDYLTYYKMGDGPYYLFYRPYHLCHLETPTAVASVALNHRPILTPAYGRLTDVFSYAKRDVRAGEAVEHAIGGDRFYGLIDRSETAEANNQVPVALMEPEDGRHAVVTRDLQKDEPLTTDAIELPDTYLNRLFEQQTSLERTSVEI